ncbi:20S proteasome subunit alpha 6 [Cryptococcus deuterogattii R265]|uniref:Proteasome subunit alpha type n=1 Tax=Cryptococcus deuterogattii (strain R265) TaxID=294750 RepID=A0A095CJU0_CRYD2|nr:20S proteasome subunit alpha 6 [Cryptococcus deuterogattii R265]KIR28697.1 20S proteasome subunit alpha 6 [Cryptococcus deuterogattii LA55]KIR71279.1 20S proteasome subunit alpha 6 [Cryptococcus deuterogattii CA1014]KIR94541.1 20S proteasome subunit alpha 6 [Cryptococcus deuterogattii CBS 10090]
MFRNSYDSDNTTFSPQGKLFQVEYALEAVKQGSAAIGLRSNTHAVLLTLKRSTGELATYQKKLIRIDDHVGVAIAGLTSDARVLSNYMRQKAMQSRMTYGRATPVARLVQSIADRAQTNTQEYGRRPYGVGFLVIGKDETGPHLFEFSPAGTAFEYYAHSIGARSQSAKTYLEKNYRLFPTASLEELINHGLSALHDTLQQDKHLSSLNTSIAIIGPAEGQGVEDVSKSAAAQRGGFRVWENEGVEGILRGWRRSRGEPEEGPEEEGEAQGEPSAEGQTEAGAGQQEGQPPAEDVTMQE